MHLAEFIEQHHQKIIKEWVEFARALHPWSKGMSEKDLQDHAEELLEAIVTDMKAAQTSAQKSEKSKGRSPKGALTRIGHKHATDRLQTGFKLDQLVSEYRALRASVVRLWGAAHGDKQGELTRFNESIDETLAEAAVWYSEQLAHTREQFLAILGHDLRNPLAAITMGATVLTKSETLDDKHSRVATRILSSAERMSRMVGDLLDLARTRLGSSIPLTRAAETDLAPLCQQVLAELAVVHPDSELRFESSGHLSGTWDSDRLTQVISNLVANALQHGVAPVTVVAQDHGDEVLLQVHNEGRPIPEGALKSIFEPMGQRSAHGGQKNATGLGLGLYIAHEVVTAHGGTIGVISTEKEGTTFSVRLPRRPSDEKILPGRTKKEEDQPDEQNPPFERFRSQDRRQDDRRSPPAPATE